MQRTNIALYMIDEYAFFTMRGAWIDIVEMMDINDIALGICKIRKILILTS